MKKYSVYILYSNEKDRYYIGQTWNIKLRELRHLIGTTRYTKQAKDWRLVYKEDFGTRSEAILREMYIKKQKSRVFIENLIMGS